MAEKFETKDSGKREDLAGGMVRDTAEGKVDYTLILKGPLHQRWAELLTRGAMKYGKHNWCKALTATDVSAREQTKDRFKESAMRHFMQWMQGDRTEDHAAAVVFNLNGFEAMCDSDPTAAIQQMLSNVGLAAMQRDAIDQLDAELEAGFNNSAVLKVRK